MTKCDDPTKLKILATVDAYRGDQAEKSKFKVSATVPDGSAHSFCRYPNYVYHVAG